jgi:hypothetical protein
MGLITPNFVQRINGQVYDRDQYIPHVREMRLMVTGGGELQVLEQLATATGSAGRYLFRMEGRRSLLSPTCLRGSKTARSTA